MAKSLAGAAFLLLLAIQPGQAETAATWFALDPAPAAAQGDAPLDVFFYSRTARYQGVARLSETFVLKPGDADDASLPAGTPLYLVRGKKNAYYCSPKSPRQPNAGELSGTVLKAALGFGLFGGPVWARAASPQCFRDTDNDGRFDEVAYGFASFPPIAHNAQLNEPIAIANPVKYETLDAAALPPPLTLGLMATAQLLGGDRFFNVKTCLRVEASDFSTADLICFPLTSTTVNARNLPAAIDFLDGQVSITAIASDAAGGVSLHYALTTPPTTPSIMLVSKATLSANIVHELFYNRPPK